MKRKLIWSNSNNSKVVVFRGEDGDLFVGYEAGIPVRVRDLLDSFYKASSKMRDLERTSYLLKKAHQIWIDKHKDMFEKMGYTLELKD